MTPKEKPRFVEVLTAVAATFRQEPTEALLLGYWLGLQDLPLADVMRAAVRAMRESKFLPSVADLRGLAGDIPPEQRAVVAWDAVHQAYRRHGYYHSVDFDDPAVNAAIRNLGGWEKFAERCEEEDVVWLRKEFERVYVAYVRRGVTLAEGAALLGYYERVNLAAGHRVDRLVRIETTLTPCRMLAGPGPGREKIAVPTMALLENIGKPEEART